MFRWLSLNAWVILLWAIFTIISLYIRPLFPVDETRYASVAWEMWQRGDFLVPYLNGETYSHKPPLLFWLMHLSWSFFGVNDWSLRCIAPMFALATILLASTVSGMLWPERTHIKAFTSLLLMGSWFWMIYNTLTMFDMLLAFFTLLSIYCLLQLINKSLAVRYWILLGIALAGGILSKGPVILLQTLPVALLAPWWLGNKTLDFQWKHWYFGLFSAILLSACIALCWAIPAGIAGGEAYQNAIFLGQTSGRLVKSFAHQLPWWWYLERLPLLFLPWLFWKPFWVSLRNFTNLDCGLRFCLAWSLPVFVMFSLVSGKRIHYLLPIIPAFVMLIARLLDQGLKNEKSRNHQSIMLLFGLLGATLALLPSIGSHYHGLADVTFLSPIWGMILFAVALALALIETNSGLETVFYISLVSIVALTMISLGFFQIKANRYDTRITAQAIAKRMDENKAIAFYGSKYHGQYHFTGRLNHAITVISNFPDLSGWAEQHQTGYIIVSYQEESPTATLVENPHPFKGQFVGLLSCQTLRQHPELDSVLKP